MAIDKTELSSAVLTNLEIGSSDVTTFKVYENLSAAQLQLINVLPIAFLREACKTVLFDLATETEYQWPADFIRLQDIYINYTNTIDQDNPGVLVVEFKQENFLQLIKTIATTSYPFVELDVQSGFRIYPKPSSAVTKGGRLRYIFKVPDISASQDSVLSATLKNLLIFKATALSALIEDYRPDLSKKFDEQYAAELRSFLPKKENKVKIK